MEMQDWKYQEIKKDKRNIENFFGMCAMRAV